MSMARDTIQFVTKISKFCNLRCAYCYEYAELNNKARMPLSGLKSFFKSTSNYARAHNISTVSFVWHGGEPLLIPIESYLEIDNLQHEAFGTNVPIWNTAQTNLTILSDRWCEFLVENRFFAGLGVSFDVYGDQRVDINGRLYTAKVLGNLQRLLDYNIDFGAICVLARNTLPDIDRIYAFYEQLGIECRFLPFYRSVNEDQHMQHALAGSEIVNALKSIFDQWFTSEHGFPVEPIESYLDFAIAYLNGQRHRFYDKLNEECIFVVDPAGDVWGVADTYNVACRYGNVFKEPFEAVLESPIRVQTCLQSEQRIEKYCRGCKYLGACPGYFAADATPEQRTLLDAGYCTVREVISHMLVRFDQSNLTKRVRPAINRHPEKLAVAPI